MSDARFNNLKADDKCPECGGPLILLFQSYACRLNSCDLPPEKRPKPTKKMEPTPTTTPDWDNLTTNPWGFPPQVGPAALPSTTGLPSFISNVPKDPNNPWIGACVACGGHSITPFKAPISRGGTDWLASCDDCGKCYS